MRQETDDSEAAAQTALAMKQSFYSLFDTPLGFCGIAWMESANSAGDFCIVFFQLPEASKEATENRIAQKSGAAKSSEPPSQIAEIIQRVRKHLSGEVQDFRDVPVALPEIESFARKIYEAARQIPPGQITTYGAMAKNLGCPTAARAIGQALGNNPIPLIIPCHRILAAGTKSGGFSAHGGRKTKTKLLAIEGAVIEPPLFP
jgi:O-6-methylguanine DNA methyltransferase